MTALRNLRAHGRLFLTCALIVSSICLLALSGVVESNLSGMRADFSMQAANPLENAPPLLAFTTVALGGFRGIITDVLWLRMLGLQDEGRFFEIVQLADWITKMEPEAPEVWSFQSWNMAFNISVMMSDPEDKWRWIMNAFRLLLDEGMPCNPGSPALAWEMGWLFQHKISATYDPSHLYYKGRLAADVEANIPGGALGSATAAGREWLESSFGISPATAADLDSRLGPLDWRLPYTHSLYWGYVTRQSGSPEYGIKGARMMYQSMSDIFENGMLSYDTAGGEYLTAPRMDVFDKVISVYEDACLRYPDADFSSAYGFFLANATAMLHRAGELEKARRAFEMLGTRFPKMLDGKTYEEVIAERSERRQGTP